MGKVIFRSGGLHRKKQSDKCIFDLPSRAFGRWSDGYAALDGGRIVVLKVGNGSSGILDFGFALYMFTFSFLVEGLKSIWTRIRVYEFITWLRKALLNSRNWYFFCVSYPPLLSVFYVVIVSVRVGRKRWRQMTEIRYLVYHCWGTWLWAAQKEQNQNQKQKAWAHNNSSHSAN